MRNADDVDFIAPNDIKNQMGALPEAPITASDIAAIAAEHRVLREPFEAAIESRHVGLHLRRAPMRQRVIRDGVEIGERPRRQAIAAHARDFARLITSLIE